MTKHDIHPGYLELRPFAFYDAQGRIHGTGIQGWKASEENCPKGQSVLFADADRMLDYVDTSSGEPIVTKRPVFDGVFGPASVPVETEATLPGLPACTITYEGPESGSHEHEGGDLVVGFTSPGDYTLTCEPFPYLPATLTLTVTA
ncbi:hypothetical protein [Methylorubrum extorquens]|uniref:hypothetical protein n=1 Tax=Methylorubrum extorquens TaxID=408 RepID=UPI00209E92EA|nr:hypothetical protein [Methylorubrum extorquens]MCP1540050.1 hypothetical protein [Methylorubrum extorquens]